MSQLIESESDLAPGLSQDAYWSSVSVNNTIFKLVERIKKKITSGYEKDVEELKLLREQCGSDNPLVSVTACHGLVCLVKDSYCPLSNTVSALVASLFSVKSVTGVISALTDLLVWELKCELSTSEPEDRYSSPYNTKSPQHPLVSILKRRSQSWPDVLNQVSAICCHPDKQVQSHTLEMVKPVLDYILMECNELPESCRMQAFKIISNYFFNKDYLSVGLSYCLCWPSSRALEAVQVVSLVAQAAVASKHGLLVSQSCLALAALLPRVLLSAHTPQPVLTLLSQLLPNATNTHNALLALLSASVTVCPALYLHCLLEFFLEVIERRQCSQDCIWMCVSALLPWLASNPSHLKSALQSASMILSHANSATANSIVTTTLISNTSVAMLVSADARLTEAIHVARLSESLQGDNAATLCWLQNLKMVDKNTLHLYISALLLDRPEPEVRLAALQALTESQAPMAASHNLTVLLYQLAREQTPNNQLALLRALPSTAKEKNNVLGVVSTLEAIRRSGHQNLSLLAVDLYCQLWMNQERCYSQLIDVLEHDCSTYEDRWLVYTLQANVCKAICTAKPELHGKEVVSKVSEILNKCGGVKEAAASALALEALIPLCSHDVVDVFSIWNSLAPRFSRDKRPSVLKSLCELLSLAAVQKTTNAGADNTLHNILSWLWNLVAANKHSFVTEHALQALSKFRVDQMKLKMLPECFRKDIKLPSEMVKTPADAARKPEDVLDYIPGECWIQVVQHVKSEAVCLAVANWIKMEVASFRGSSLYQVDRAEPTSYAHLPHRSVLRGLTTSLQQLCSALHGLSDISTGLETADLCIYILLQPTPKPLPSLSWSFLNPLIDTSTGSDSIEHNIIRLAAKQSQISPTARKITEKYINDSGNDKEKIKFIYYLLIDLCRGIPPVILRPFLEKTLLSALNEKDNELLSTLLGCIKISLKEEKIHDANRTLLHQQVKGLWDLIDPQHCKLPEYFSCVSELPVSTVESMTSTSLMWEVTSVQLQKSFRLRAFMALIPGSTQPLNWLNEIIDVASSNITEQFLALELVSEVCSHLWQHSTAWPWLQELMGQTHLTSVNNKDGVEFLVAVFMLCVDIISGYSSFASKDEDDLRNLRFPQAVTYLIHKHGDGNSMLEWLNHMSSVESFPSHLAPHFQQAARNLSVIIS